MIEDLQLLGFLVTFIMMYGLFRVVAAFMKSSKSLEEAIAFFESEMVEKDEELKPKRRGGRRKKSK